MKKEMEINTINQIYFDSVKMERTLSEFAREKNKIIQFYQIGTIKGFIYIYDYIVDMC